MLDSLDELSVALTELAEEIDSEEPIMTRANALVRQIEGLNSTYSKRQDVLLV